MALILFLLFTGIEAFFLIWSIFSKSLRREERSIVRIAELLLLVIVFLTGALNFSFRFGLLLPLLVIQAIVGVVILVRKKEKPYRLWKPIFLFIKNTTLLSLALTLLFVFPETEQPKPTGSYQVQKAKYTFVDQNRIETFHDKGESRELTVEFWYPKTKKPNEKFPLVVFSHGAFGFSGSNHSTFMELASNGYVVASIGHTYHAFFTRSTAGKLTLVDQNFLNSAIEINAMNDVKQEKEIYLTKQKWMKLRTDDENFVLDTILSKAGSKKNALFSHINIDKIGLFGHSMGGASSAQLGRDRTDIDAVIVLDGTMLGEEIDFQNGKSVLTDRPYPVPLLNVYAEDHYTGAKKLCGDEYNNFVATKNAVCAYEVVFKQAGHLNFTDLPLFSPLLAKKLGVGTVDAKYCIETTNRIVLEFFDGFLKEKGILKFNKEY